MTLDQALAFGLMAATIGAFLWGRLPYDLVAVLALLIGVALGIVPAEEAFSGFGDDVVVIVAAALLVSSGVARSGAIETAMRPLLRHLRGPARPRCSSWRPSPRALQGGWGSAPTPS